MTRHSNTFPRITLAFRGLFLFLAMCILTLSLVTCTKETGPGPGSGVLVEEIILPPEGLPAWSLQMELVAGHPENEALMLEARVSPHAWILVFPVNGILPGMQLRFSGQKRTLVDMATSRTVPLGGARTDIVGSAFHGPAALSLSRVGDQLQLAYSMMQAGGFSSRLVLTLNPAGPEWPTVKEILPLISLVARVRIPPEVLEQPVMGWHWRIHSAGQSGFAGIRILQARPATLQKEDLRHDPPQFRTARLTEVLPQMEGEAKTKGPLVESRHRPGILYVNRKPHVVLGTSRPVFLGEIPFAHVMLVPLAGGLPIAEQTVRGHDVWTFTR